MSLTSRMLIKFLQLSGMKGKLAKGSQKTFEEAVSYNRKHPFIMPKDHKAIYEQIDIHTSFGICPCVKITQPDSCRDHAVLFTWGGGGMVVRFLTTQDIAVDKAIIDAGTAPYQYPKWICRRSACVTF